MLEDLHPVVLKLLQKAGKDPRLTPRLLREKSAQRLGVDKDTLKPYRNKIKDIIMEWYDATVQQDLYAMSQLSRFAKANGLSPAMFAELAKIEDKSERVVQFRNK